MRSLGSVLVVDDEEYVRESVAEILRRAGFSVRTAAGVDEAVAAPGLDGMDAVLTDLRMPGRDGLELLREVLRVEPSLPVIMLTAHGTITSAIDCMKAGAFHYLQKPVDPEELILTVRRALRESGVRRELEYLREGPDGSAHDDAPLGVSRAWRQVLELAEVAAPSDTSVLLLGESGTGKEEIAKYIHRRSRRSDAAFVCVNCAAIPLELFESEFFGHRRGSFTGAVEDRVGRVKVAHQGTLFLDEINSLPLTAQAKVLRFLEDGVFQRVGDSQPAEADTRIVSASNSDLRGDADVGRFRRDLFYRINVMTIALPPLRERPEDVPVLARAFLREIGARLGKELEEVSPQALDALMRYAWPGNVRELRNVIERGVLLERTDRLELVSLPQEIGGGASGSAAPSDLRSALRTEERRLIEAALEASGGVRREAARILGIDERNLSYYLRKHDLGGARP
ncbi:MAG: sigma-54-dependent transcriptional regulator [Candidatus Eiseniibacteriota bacterium]